MTDGPRARALARLPPYPFALLEQKASAAEGTRRVLRFAIGDPDLPPPSSLVQAALGAMRTPGGNRYSSSRGEPELREAFAEWFHKRFGVSVDPAREVAVLVGSKEGLTALPRALLDPGARVIVPDPGYPAYENAVRLARLRPARLPLDPERGWRPVWDRMPAGGSLVYLNYPNNPTGAVVGRETLAEGLDRVREAHATLAYDNAYSELTFGGPPAPSILELPGAREVAVEFHSLSKTLGIPGWRIGFAVGNAERIAALTDLKSHSDSGAARPLQSAAAQLLREYGAEGWPAEVRSALDEYGQRLRTLAKGLTEAGWPVDEPRGTLYLWQRVPRGDGARFAGTLLEKYGILVTPGGAFGRGGRRYVRWAVTAPSADLAEALDRLRSAGDLVTSAARGRAAP
jgi:LL-diaminopimelate aminotransferase